MIFLVYFLIWACYNTMNLLFIVFLGPMGPKTHWVPCVHSGLSTKTSLFLKSAKLIAFFSGQGETLLLMLLCVLDLLFSSLGCHVENLQP